MSLPLPSFQVFLSSSGFTNIELPNPEMNNPNQQANRFHNQITQNILQYNNQDVEKIDAVDVKERSPLVQKLPSTISKHADFIHLSIKETRPAIFKTPQKKNLSFESKRPNQYLMNERQAGKFNLKTPIRPIAINASINQWPPFNYPFPMVLPLNQQNLLLQANLFRQSAFSRPIQQNTPPKQSFSNVSSSANAKSTSNL